MQFLTCVFNISFRQKLCILLLWYLNKTMMGSKKAHYNVRRLKEHDIYYVSIINIPKCCHDVLHLFIDVTLVLTKISLRKIISWNYE